jgi:hypothetical protein
MKHLKESEHHEFLSELLLVWITSPLEMDCDEKRAQKNVSFGVSVVAFLVSA